MKAIVQSVTYHLPDQVLNNETLAALSEDWTADKIEEKTGIAERRIASEEECASDLAYAAAKKMFDSGACTPEEIDYILLCTQSPDYFLPTTACLLQERLGIPRTSGALDFNLGCSGYVYGLGLAKGLIESGQASKVLLITAETYSKYIGETDLNVRTLFGDAAACTLLSSSEQTEDQIGPFLYGTDGRGAENLIVKQGGFRTGPASTPPCLFMDGPEIFTFTLIAVPKAVKQLLKKAELTFEEIDQVIFHQANHYMLEHLRKKLKIPEEKFFVSMNDVGNTVSSTVPIALSRAVEANRIQAGDRVLLVGFGVGYSWGATLIRWPG